MRATDIFNKLSYLQYVFMLVSGYFYFLFIQSLMNQAIDWSELNNVLVFVGLAISISTLQDTTKTQNNLSRKVWESPRNGKIFLFVLTITTLLVISLGLVGFLNSAENIHKEISIGLVVFGIGLIGLLKTAIEMFENHRKDKNP